MRVLRSTPLLNSDPPEWVVYDELGSCSYLPGQVTRVPLRLPTRRLNASQLEQRLAAGDRRQGVLLYRPSCPRCTACQAIRIDVGEFSPNRTQRKIFRRGESLLQTTISRPSVTAEKVALYNRHKIGRNLMVGDGLIDVDGYNQFLVETCADSVELTYWRSGCRVGVAIADRAIDSLSAVYCFYDPDLAKLGIGTFSILKQLELCREWGLRYLYLGLYVAGCAPMSYKVRYLPHERLVNGTWQKFES
ncbi:MAG: arginyltransferase [Deltaproteobacteria bacterium]|nr:arginyltransferase [Deltaproteobacteria bacterium]